jgi:hypothetical protein
VENVFEALNMPGQWYLDRPEGRLYYLARPGLPGEPRRDLRRRRGPVPVWPQLLQLDEPDELDLSRRHPHLSGRRLPDRRYLAPAARALPRSDRKVCALVLHRPRWKACSGRVVLPVVAAGHPRSRNGHREDAARRTVQGESGPGLSLRANVGSGIERRDRFEDRRAGTSLWGLGILRLPASDRVARHEGTTVVRRQPAAGWKSSLNVLVGPAVRRCA